MSNKKYEFTGKEKVVSGVALRQIVCVTAFASVAVGDIGGWIEKESNLSHKGDAWVGGNAMVYGDARVYDDAWVYDNAEVFGDAWVGSNARVFRNAIVCYEAEVFGDDEVCTGKAITLSTNNHHVTITDTHITIDCRSRKKEFWASAGFDEVFEIADRKSAETWVKYKQFIMMLAGVEDWE